MRLQITLLQVLLGSLSSTPLLARLNPPEGPSKVTQSVTAHSNSSRSAHTAGQDLRLHASARLNTTSANDAHL
jgi:hypothetical protein